MAFDVYAGTLTRYYTDDWENVVQRKARLEGMKYHRITPGEPTTPPSAAEASLAVREWCAALTTALGKNISEPISWSESADLPYFTDRPGWPGYTALLLWAAYAHVSHLQRPTTLPDGWVEDPAFLASLPRDSGTPYRQIVQASLWLPCKFDFAFKAPDITGEETWIGSTFALQRQLELLNARTFNADEADLHAFLTLEFTASDEVEHAAKFALATFLQISRDASATGVPIVLSY